MIKLSGHEVLGIDAGTSGLSIVLYSPTLQRILGVGSSDYPDDNTRDARLRGRVEHYSEWWKFALKDAMISLRTELGKRSDCEITSVAGIGVTGHMHGLVRLDQNGKSFRGCDMWNDGRASAESAILFSTLGEAIPERFTFSHILWRAIHEPEEWAMCHRVTVPSGYLVARLSGEHVLGPGDASGMLGVLGKDGQISREKLAALQKLDAFRNGRSLQEMVPRVVPAGQVAARLSREGSELLGGIPVGTPIAPPEGDQPSALVASGARPGELALSAGTSLTGNLPSVKGFVPENESVNVLATADGLIQLMVCVRNGTNGFDKYRKGLAALAGKDAKVITDELTRLAAYVPPDCYGAMVLQLFQGENVVQRLNAKGAFLNVPLDMISNPGVLARLLLEGPCHVLRYGLELAAQKVGPVTAVLLSGGVLHSEGGFAPQLFADVLGLPVRARVGDEEGTAKGAALLAAYMVHVQEQGTDVSLADFVRSQLRGDQQEWLPTPGARAQYEKRFAAFRRLLLTVSDVVAADPLTESN